MNSRQILNIAVYGLLVAFCSCGNNTKVPQPNSELAPLVKEFKNKSGEQRYNEFVSILKAGFESPSATAGIPIDFYSPKGVLPLSHFIEWCGEPNARMDFLGKDTVFYEIDKKNDGHYYGILIIENEIVKKASIIPYGGDIIDTKTKLEEQTKWLQSSPKFEKIDFNLPVLRTFGLELGANIERFKSIGKSKDIRIFTSMNPLNKRVGSVEFTKPLDGCTDALSLKASILDNIIYQIHITTRTDSFYNYLRNELNSRTKPEAVSKKEGFDDYMATFGETRIRISIFNRRAVNSHIYFIIDPKLEIANEIYEASQREYYERKNKESSNN